MPTEPCPLLFINTFFSPSHFRFILFQTNLKKFMDHTQHRSVEKLVKLLDRGLDPNFHDLETGGGWPGGRSSSVSGEAGLW